MCLLANINHVLLLLYGLLWLCIRPILGLSLALLLNRRQLVVGSDTQPPDVGLVVVLHRHATRHSSIGQQVRIGVVTVGRFPRSPGACGERPVAIHAGHHDRGQLALPLAEQKNRLGHLCRLEGEWGERERSHSTSLFHLIFFLSYLKDSPYLPGHRRPFQFSAWSPYPCPNHGTISQPLWRTDSAFPWPAECPPCSASTTDPFDWKMENEFNTAFEFGVCVGCL